MNRWISSALILHVHDIHANTVKEIFRSILIDSLLGTKLDIITEDLSNFFYAFYLKRIHLNENEKPYYDLSQKPLKMYLGIIKTFLHISKQENFNSKFIIPILEFTLEHKEFLSDKAKQNTYFYPDYKEEFQSLKEILSKIDNQETHFEFKFPQKLFIKELFEAIKDRVRIGHRNEEASLKNMTDIETMNFYNLGNEICNMTYL